MALRFIFFDTETTGTFAGRDRIIEIAAFDPLKGKTFEMLINPGIPIPKDATFVHKITDEMVQQAPSFKEVASKFLEFCSGDVALIAHNNIAFDKPFLQAEMKRADLFIPTEWLFIDSLVWARRYRKDLPRHSLQYLRQIYGIKENQAHRALNDVMVLYEVFCCMTDDLSPEEIHRLLVKAGLGVRQTQAETVQQPSTQVEPRFVPKEQVSYSLCS